MQELVSFYRQLERQERLAVRRVNQEERGQFSQVTSCLRQMLVDQRSLMMDVECVGQVVETLDRTLMDNMIVVGGEEEDKISACSSLRSLRSVSSSLSSRSQSPLVPAEAQARVVRRDRTNHWVRGRRGGRERKNTKTNYFVSLYNYITVNCDTRGMIPRLWSEVRSKRLTMTS